jgi:serine/threonine protein kinase
LVCLTTAPAKPSPSLGLLKSAPSTPKAKAKGHYHSLPLFVQTKEFAAANVPQFEVVDTKVGRISAGSTAIVYLVRLRGGPHRGRVCALKIIDRLVPDSRLVYKQEVDVLQRIGAEGDTTNKGGGGGGKARDAMGVIGLVAHFELPSCFLLFLHRCAGGHVINGILTATEHDANAVSERTLARLARRLFSTLARMHALDIAHRDIKPENLLFESPLATGDDGGGNDHASASEARDTVGLDLTSVAAKAVPIDANPLFFVDFGNACVVADDVRVTDTCGSPLYISQEILQDKLDSDSVGMLGSQLKASDVWSLAVVLYTIAFGRTPFGGRRQSDMFGAILRCDYTLDHPRLSASFRDFLAKTICPLATPRLTAAQTLLHPFLATAELDVASPAAGGNGGVTDTDASDGGASLLPLHPRSLETLRAFQREIERKMSRAIHNRSKQREDERQSRLTQKRRDEEQRSREVLSSRLSSVIGGSFDQISSAVVSTPRGAK